jgi:hypothetical protein
MKNFVVFTLVDMSGGKKPLRLGTLPLTKFR